MNEVTKLYENVGIRPNYIDACTVEDKYWQNEELANEYGTFDMYMNAKCGHQEDCTTLCSCAYTKEEYPPFTAEKQIAIIKWLLESYDIGFSKLGQRIDTSLDGANCISGLGSGDTFEESLAQAINDLWQDLTDAEKVQIRGILE